MFRVNRPFDRWFDLSDPYDEMNPAGRRKERPSPEAHREWTYDTPTTPVPLDRRQETPPRQEPETPRPAC